jgi:hypothetical protein
MRAKVGVGLVLLLAVALQAPVVADIVAGSGLSTEADPVAAGKAAAEQARKALGDKPAKVVLVFQSYPRAEQAKVLEGIAAVFDKGITHGCSGLAAVTDKGNPAGKAVGLLALGGDIEVAAALSPTIAGKHHDAGKALAEKLPKMANARLLILFGNCHVDSNKRLVEGAQEVVGKDLPIIGGAASGPATDSYFQGAVAPDTAVGILLGGDFKVAACSLGGSENNEVVLRTAGEAAKTAAAELKGKPAAGFVFECTGRCGKIKNLSDEMPILQGALGKELPLIGFYGSGEIGPENGVWTGFGYHIVCCLIGQ